MKARGDKPHTCISIVMDLATVEFWAINDDEDDMTLSQRWDVVNKR